MRTSSRWGAIQAIAEAGLSVPHDISVAGYDNTMFAAFEPISLTTVDQAGRQIGTNAAHLLLARMADRERRSTQVTLSPRSSSAAPRRHRMNHERG